VLAVLLLLVTGLHWTRPTNGELEDLWDFGTVRHVGRPGTIGRPPVSGPPLTWENDDTAQHTSEPPQASRRVSTNSTASSVTVKGDLPSLPIGRGSVRRADYQATVRHAPPSQSTQRMETPKQSPVKPPPRRQPSDEYDDAYPELAEDMQSKLELEEEEDDLPDTAMLDSVILPAIASVSKTFLPP